MTVTWDAYSTFDIPEDAKLMSAEDNAAVTFGEAVGSWAIKWNKLHYIDEDWNEQVIEGSEIEFEGKNPSDSNPPCFDEPVIKGENECFHCRAEAFGTYGNTNLPMCREHKRSTGNSDTDNEEEKEQ